MLELDNQFSSIGHCFIRRNYDGNPFLGHRIWNCPLQYLNTNLVIGFCKINNLSGFADLRSELFFIFTNGLEIRINVIKANKLCMSTKKLCKWARKNCAVSARSSFFEGELRAEMRRIRCSGTQKYDIKRAQ